MKGFSRVSILGIVLLFCFYSGCVSTDVSYDGRAIKIDGQRRILISGAIHYPRSTAEMWPSLIKKAKDGGLNAIETYVFWNAHEPEPGQYDFTGNLDIIKFLKTIQDEGLYAILRIGPYVCAEWNFGGIPVWLYNRPNVTFRTYNEGFMQEMQKFTTLIVEMVKEERLFAPDGGPIILAQIENEYGNIMGSFGQDGIKYMNWCAEFANGLNIGVPWIMCQQGNAPDSVIDTCNGHYCDQWWPTRKTIPKIWTENWTGWYTTWGDRNQHRPAEDLAFAVARFFQLRGTLQNYYMYHGGSNFGRTSGGPWIVTSYDYDSPLDEYGLVNEPKWGHLKRLHEILLAVEDVLTYGDFKDTSYYDSWAYQSTEFNLNGTRICFFSNADQKDITVTFKGRTYFIPSWSTSIYYNDCETEVYNTARVTTQASSVEKTLVPMDNSASVWLWREEVPEKYPQSITNGYMTDRLIYDQKAISNDTSDYVWFMTSVDLNESSPIWGETITLQLLSTGNVLHVFFNDEHIGTQPANYFVTLNFLAKPRPGKNYITLLSGTVGFQNYGAFYERGWNGVVGPVKLISTNNRQIDLSNNTWVYKVGLNGIDVQKLYDDNVPNTWNSGPPVNKEFIWYKRYFTTPPGEDPVVLYLNGMGKGTAWVNGHNLGRYYPSSYAPEKGCDACNYRGKYNHDKCFTDCGNSTQSWYHVPRSFLFDDQDNSLIMFEEIGGNPLDISIHTVSLRTIYASVPEGYAMELTCHGKNISGINFASFGSPSGTLGSLRRGSNDARDSMDLVNQACVGKESCSIEASNRTFGRVRLANPKEKKTLTVEALCS